MALTYTLSSHSYDGRYLRLTCSQTQNIASNTSTISWTLESVGGNSNNYSVGPTTVYIDGVQVYYKERVSFSSGLFPAIKGSTSGNLTVNHLDNGSKSVSVSLSTDIYNSNVRTTSGTWTLDDNPRKALIASAHSFTDLIAPTILYTNPLGNSVSTLDAFIYSADDKVMYAGYRNLDKTGVSYTFTLTQAEMDKLLTDSANVASLPIKFYVRTVIDGVEYWSGSSTKSFTVEGGEPITSITIQDTNRGTTNLTGDPNTIVRGKSILSYEIEATAQKKATISKYYFRGNNETTARESATGTINNPSTDTYVYTVVDSRGKKTTKTVIVPYVPYVEVSAYLKSAKISLSGETAAKVDVEIEGNYFDGSFGAEDNELHFSCHLTNAEDNEGVWIELSNLTIQKSDNKYTATGTIDGLDYLQSYTIQIQAKDAIGVGNSNPRPVSLKPIFDWSQNDFRFNVPIKIKNQSLANFVIEEGTLDGWTYRRWSNGIAECWKSLEHSTTMNTAWGALYCGTTLMERQSYPIVFVERPKEYVSLMAGGNAGWLTPESGGRGINGPYASAIYNVVRPNSSAATTKFYFNFYVVGRWAHIAGG